MACPLVDGAVTALFFFSNHVLGCGMKKDVNIAAKTAPESQKGHVYTEGMVPTGNEQNPGNGPPRERDSRLWVGTYNRASRDKMGRAGTGCGSICRGKGLRSIYPMPLLPRKKASDQKPHVVSHGAERNPARRDWLPVKVLVTQAYHRPCRTSLRRGDIGHSN
jgi:hypothetical protein